MKHLTLSIALACSALSLNAQQAEPFLSPQVQKGQLQTKYIARPKSFKLEGFPLLLGVLGDKSVRSV